MNNILPLDSIESGELFEALKAGRLKGPNANSYKSNDWLASAKDIETITARDLELLYSALYFGKEFESLRALMRIEQPRLSLSDSVDFVVAGLNVQASTVISRARKKLRKKSRDSDAVHLSDGGGIRIQNAGSQELSPDDLLANIVDGMANILYNVIDFNRASSAVDRNQALINAPKIMTLASIEQALKDLWGRVVWDGCTIQAFEGFKQFTVGNEEFAKLWLAWQSRFMTITSQGNNLTVGEALMQDDRKPRQPILARTVIGIENRAGRKQDYIIGKARSSGSEQAAALSAIEATYLKAFLDEILPSYKQTGLTYRDLWRAWWILQDIAKLHQAQMPNRGCRSWNEVGACALRFSISRASKAIAEAAQMPLSSAEIIINIFTANPNMSDRGSASDLFQNSTWGRPILRIGNEDRGRIALASILAPNPIMIMERWMTRTGMMDDPKNRKKKTVRGKVFERVARERIQLSGSNNSQISGFHICYLSSRGQGSEEIDLLVRFGSTIIVCEMKCLNIPLSPISRYNHLVKIKEAVEQVNRKVEWCKIHQELILDALSTPRAERDITWNLAPMVVLSTAFGAGLIVDGCAVTDLDWLSSFLGSSHVLVDGTFERGRGVSFKSQTLYGDQADLEHRITEIAASPPSLALELGRVEWEEIPFPTHSGEPFLLKVPFLKDLLTTSTDGK